MTYRIRAYQAKDAAAVDAIVLRAFEQYAEAYSDWPRFSSGLGLAKSAHESEIIVAEVDQEIAGAVAYIGPGQPRRPFYPLHWPVVRLLVVDPRHRGLGIGRALMEECIDRAQRDKAPVIALHTSTLMSVALPMYERMGFTLERELEPMHGVSYGLYVKRLSAGV